MKSIRVSRGEGRSRRSEYARCAFKATLVNRREIYPRDLPEHEPCDYSELNTLLPPLAKASRGGTENKLSGREGLGSDQEVPRPATFSASTPWSALTQLDDI